LDRLLFEAGGFYHIYPILIIKTYFTRNSNMVVLYVSRFGLPENGPAMLNKTAGSGKRLGE